MASTDGGNNDGTVDDDDDNDDDNDDDANENTDHDKEYRDYRREVRKRKERKRKKKRLNHKSLCSSLRSSSSKFDLLDITPSSPPLPSRPPKKTTISWGTIFHIVLVLSLNCIFYVMKQTQNATTITTTTLQYGSLPHPNTPVLDVGWSSEGSPSQPPLIPSPSQPPLTPSPSQPPLNPSSSPPPAIDARNEDGNEGGRWRFMVIPKRLTEIMKNIDR